MSSVDSSDMSRVSDHTIFVCRWIIVSGTIFSSTKVGNLLFHPSFLLFLFSLLYAFAYVWFLFIGLCFSFSIFTRGRFLTNFCVQFYLYDANPYPMVSLSTTHRFIDFYRWRSTSPVNTTSILLFIIPSCGSFILSHSCHLSRRRDQFSTEGRRRIDSDDFFRRLGGVGGVQVTVPEVWTQRGWSTRGRGVILWLVSGRETEKTTGDIGTGGGGEMSREVKERRGEEGCEVQTHSVCPTHTCLSDLVFMTLS